MLNGPLTSTQQKFRQGTDSSNYCNNFVCKILIEVSDPWLLFNIEFFFKKYFYPGLIACTAMHNLAKKVKAIQKIPFKYSMTKTMRMCSNRNNKTKKSC